MKKILTLVVLSLSIPLHHSEQNTLLAIPPKSQARTLTKRQRSLRRKLAKQEKRSSSSPSNLNWKLLLTF